METLTIVNGDIYTPTHYGQGSIVIQDDTISTITKDALQPTGETIDASGCLVIPGLIDGLVHGGGGCDSMTGEVEDVATIARAHARNGVTSLVLGISSGSMAQINDALTAIALCRRRANSGRFADFRFLCRREVWEPRQKRRAERKIHYVPEL